MVARKFVFNVYNNGGKLLAQREAWGKDRDDAEKSARALHKDGSGSYYMLVGEVC